MNKQMFQMKAHQTKDVLFLSYTTDLSLKANNY